MVTRRKALGYLMLVPAALVFSGSLSANNRAEAGTEKPRPPKIHFPSPEYPTFQSAIDALPNGGQLIIAPGLFRLEQALHIVGKRITIKGAGCSADVGDRATRLEGARPLEVVPPDRAVGLVNYTAGGGGRIKGLDISGFDAGVVRDDHGVPGLATREAEKLVITDVCISDTGRGILSRAGAPLHVKTSKINNCLWNGISAVAPLAFSFQDVFVSNAEHMGIYISHGQCLKGCATPLIKDTNVALCKAGGIVVNKSLVAIKDCFLSLNTLMGIGIGDSVADIRDSTVEDTQALFGAFGDGIVLWADSYQATALIKGNQIRDNARAGLFTIGGIVDLQSNIIECNAFDVDIEDWNGFVGEVNEPPNEKNKCDENCNDVLGDCLAVSANLGPPSSLDGQE